MKSITIKIGFSQNKDEFKAVKEVFEKIKQKRMKFVIMFADVTYDQSKINRAWRQLLPYETAFMGCSSLKISIPFLPDVYHNITPEGFKKDCIVAMSIASDKLNFSVKLMRNIKNNWQKESTRAINEASRELDLDLSNTDPKKYFGILLADTVSAKESEILENCYAMSNLPFIGGGSIGKVNLGTLLSLKASPGCIHTKEGVFSDAAVIAIVKSEIPFKIELTTSFRPTNIKFKVGQVEFFERLGMWRIYTLNKKPAVKEYINALKVSRLKLGYDRFPNFSFLINHPLGLMIKDKAYTRFIASALDNSLLVTSKVESGQELYLMERGDILQSTQKTIQKIKEELKSISGMILFNCGLRNLEAEQSKLLEELFKVINIAPLIGLCTFREYYGWLSMEQSMGILAFGN